MIKTEILDKTFLITLVYSSFETKIDLILR